MVIYYIFASSNSDNLITFAKKQILLLISNSINILKTHDYENKRIFTRSNVIGLAVRKKEWLFNV